MIVDGGANFEYVFDLMYDGDRRLLNVPVTGVAPSWDAGQFVAGSANVRVVWSDDHARSMIPRQIGDWFSPFGAELQLDCMVGAGVFSERVRIGRFVLTDTRDATGQTMPFEGRVIHPGESFSLVTKDPLVRVMRDGFAFPSGASSTSAWAEAQRITGMPVVRNVDDAAVPSTISYEGAKEPALKRLFDLMDAWPHPDEAGALTARPKEWPAPVDDIRGVVSAPREMTAERTYNKVVVTGKSPTGEPLVAAVEIVDGFLRTMNSDGGVSPFGGSVRRYHSDMLDTQARCFAYARALLRRVSRIRGVTRTVVEPFNPLREIGDVLRFEGGIVRVRQVVHSRPHTRSLVEVPD